MTTDRDQLTTRTQRAVERFMAQNGLWPDVGGIVLAVSGGQDSTALLLVLAGLAKRRRLSLTVAHFDHRLRGEAAAAKEREFVGRLCRDLGLPLVVGSADVRERARSARQSLEEAARLCRYEFLASAAREAGASHVATGHTLSDQAETVLLHVLRGAGLKGLAGMTARAPWPLAGEDGPSLLRPLLCLTRGQTLAYCLARGVQPLSDESNLSPDFRRNRLRNEVLPLLRELNPSIELALDRLAAAARADDATLDVLAAELVEQEKEGHVSIRRDASQHPEALLRRAFILAFQRLHGERRELGQRHVLALLRLLASGKTGDSLQLPRATSAVLQRDRLMLTTTPPRGPLPEEGVCLTVPGRAQFGWLLVSAGLPSPEGAATAEVDAEAVRGGLLVRRRRPGDRIQLPAIDGSKKLQDLFVDEHVSRPERDRIPLFESERGIIWVAGLRVASWALPRPGRESVTLACWQEGESQAP